MLLIKRIGDLLVAQKMGWKVKVNDLHQLAKALETTEPAELELQKKKLWEQACQYTAGQRTFHWELEFLQIFAGEINGSNDDLHNGFDIILGNPPFLGGKRISTELGEKFSKFLQIDYSPAKGSADLSSYFFRMAYALIKHTGLVGLVATNTIAQGDTRETGLAFIINQGGIVYDAQRFIEFRCGMPQLKSILFALKTLDAKTTGSIKLDGRDVPFISSWLDDLPDLRPAKLIQNQGLSFSGDFLHGSGFILHSLQTDSAIKAPPIMLR